MFRKFRKKDIETEHKYCGKTYDEMSDILDTMCNIEGKHHLTDEELDAVRVAIQCMTSIFNRMKEGSDRPIVWD